MRIIGGEARGRKLRSPPGREARPTSDRVRESLFDILGQRCDDLRVLDLYAGTGAVGLEALSRGAARVTFVERSSKILVVLKANLELFSGLGYPARAEILTADALSTSALSGVYDLIFADPPYAVGARPICEAIAKVPALVVATTRLVVEHDGRAPLIDRYGAFAKVDTRRYGDTRLTFFECRESLQPASGE